MSSLVLSAKERASCVNSARTPMTSFFHLRPIKSAHVQVSRPHPPPYKPNPLIVWLCRLQVLLSQGLFCWLDTLSSLWTHERKVRALCHACCNSHMIVTCCTYRQKQRVSKIVSEENMEDEEFGEDPSVGEPPG